MFVRNDGRVGIGTRMPGSPLAVNSSADGSIVEFESEDVVQGSVSIAGVTTSYNAFVGSHYTQLKPGQKELPIGAVVISTGEIVPSDVTKNASGINNKEYSPYIDSTSVPGDQRVYGTWLGKLSDSAEGMSFGKDSDPVYLIAQVGLFKIRVTDTNGNIANGDFLETSSRPMEAQRQTSNLKTNSTVAKSIVDVDWSLIEIDPELNYRWILIPCTF